MPNEDKTMPIDARALEGAEAEFYRTQGDMEAVIRAVLAALPAGEAEPVAWQWKTVGRRWQTIDVGEVEDAEHYARTMAGEYGVVRPRFPSLAGSRPGRGDG